MAEPKADKESGSPSAARLRLWLVRLVLLLPFLALTAAAVPRLVTGLALEAAFPATAYMDMNLVQPKATNERTAAILAKASLADGQTQIARVEAAADAGQPGEVLIPILEGALARAPGSARGWILLARLLGRSDSPRAAASVAMSLEIAPRERMLIVPRVFAAAPVWPDLPLDVRDTLLDQTRSLIETPARRDAIHGLLGIPGGPELVTRVFAGNPDLLRAFNRKMASERLGLKLRPLGR